jgi:hypothetical protein
MTLETIVEASKFENSSIQTSQFPEDDHEMKEDGSQKEDVSNRFSGGSAGEYKNIHKE